MEQPAQLERRLRRSGIDDTTLITTPGNVTVSGTGDAINTSLSDGPDSTTKAAELVRQDLQGEQGYAVG